MAIVTCHKQLLYCFTVAMGFFMATAFFYLDAECACEMGVDEARRKRVGVLVNNYMSESSNIRAMAPLARVNWLFLLVPNDFVAEILFHTDLGDAMQNRYEQFCSC